MFRPVCELFLRTDLSNRLGFLGLARGFDAENRIEFTLLGAEIEAISEPRPGIFALSDRAPHRFPSMDLRGVVGFGA